MKYAIQYLCALTILGLSTFSAWYEGSDIRDDPWEWDHSAVFSKTMNGEISSKADISQMDHFIYAAKFKPFFPVLILLSLTYMVMLIVFALLKHNTRKLIVGYITIGTLSFLTATAVSDSPTKSGAIFTSTFIAIGILNLFLSLLFFLRVKKGNATIVKLS